MIPLYRRILWSAAFIAGSRRLDRGFTCLADDIFLASYPKSGNTWVRFLIGNLISNAAVGFNNIEKVVPDSERNEDTKMLEIPSPRFIKTHSAFDPRFKRIILIVRDPREVAVSYYHFCRKNQGLKPHETIQDFVERFVAAEVGLAQYGNWGENTGSWLGARRGTPDFHLISYEQLKSDPLSQLKQITKKFNIKSTDEDIQRAVANSDFHSMKSLEDKQSKEWIATKNSDPTIPFVRSGQTETWKKELPKKSQLLIENAWRAQMQELNYF